MVRLQIHPKRLKLVLSDNAAPIIERLDSGGASNLMQVLIRLTAPPYIQIK
jgi:hypothetical protein